MNTPHERKHRLPEAAYVGRKTVTFTACVHDRKPLLARAEVVGPLLKFLTVAAVKSECVVPLYCFMPDHLHVTITGASDSSRVKGAMEFFKHRSGIWFSEFHPEVRWQPNFYDRIVRRSSDGAALLRYIACNPVRAGLASDIHEWPFTGSIGCDLRDVLGDAFW